MNSGNSYSDQILHFFSYNNIIIREINPEFGVAKGNTPLKIKLLLDTV